MCTVLLVQVFSDQLLLKDVLSRSDRTLAVVKDLFGDGPHRKTGQCTTLLFPTASVTVLLTGEVQFVSARLETKSEVKMSQHVACWFALAGHPSVTMAPKWESGSIMSESPLSVPSQTVMDQQARVLLLILSC